MGLEKPETITICLRDDIKHGPWRIIRFLNLGYSFRSDRRLIISGSYPANFNLLDNKFEHVLDLHQIGFVIYSSMKYHGTDHAFVRPMLLEFVYLFGKV